MAGIPFEMVGLSVGRTTAKPRRTGLTMMMDWGLPLARASDLLDLVGPYVDLAKIAVGTSRLYSDEMLGRKFTLYDAHGVRPFLGGQFQEYVFATQGAGALRGFLEEARRVGFAAVEISDNTVPLSDEERTHQIELAIDCGLAVFGEVGAKEETSAAETLIAQAKACFAAGAELVLVEGAELMAAGTPNRALIAALKDHLDIGRVLFELPGPWISGVALSHVHDLKKLLVAEFGPDVNIANVMPDDVLETEALRVGLSVIGPKRTR